jgi:polyhydroxybutyrate depolymerase
MRISIVLAALVALACGREPTRGTAAASTTSASAPLVVARPYVMHAPAKHDPHAPLLVVLHGYGSDHANVESHFHVDALADAHGVFVALPDGTANRRGARFWNATDSCCDFGHTGVDDVAYIDAILDDAIARYSVDPARIYVTGFSNGGFMSHRYACERAERVAAVAPFAGDPWKDEARCAPKAPVSVLQIHGDADEMVPYFGGPGRPLPGAGDRPPFPAARDGVAMWAKKDGCPATPKATDGPREEVLAWSGCNGGSEVQLWTRHGQPHVFDLTRDDMERVWTFLSAHQR